MNSSPKKRSSSSAGFTLLELMVAMSLLTIAMAISLQAFSGTIRAWKRGTEVIDGIKHGEFAMTQLASAINSTIFFMNQEKVYAFEFEKDYSGGLPADTISFVTASSAFVPENSPLKYGPHRLTLFIDDDEGYPALFAEVMPAVANNDDYQSEYDADPILITRSVQGLEILVYDEELEDWTDEWEEENSVPERIEIAIYVESEEKDEDPIIFRRVIEIPVAKSVEARLTSPSTANAHRETGNQQPNNNPNPRPRVNPGGNGPPSISIP